ncbi:hypothetical protein HYDPIDRAFT_98892, partial [Hydnomerulius pinastri MD-312]
MSGHTAAITGVVCLPEGDRVVTCSLDQTIRLWDATTGEEEGVRMEHGAIVSCVGVTKDGKRILSGGYDDKLKVWEVETQKLMEVWEGHALMFFSLAISPDGELVASGHGDGRIVIREAKSGGEIRHSIHSSGWSAVRSLCFSPSGEKIAILSGGDDQKLKVWEVETQKLVEVWEGHEREIYSVTISPDGEFVASGDTGGKIVIREAKSGGEIKHSIETNSWVYSLCFSPSGEEIASGNDDWTIRVFD